MRSNSKRLQVLLGLIVLGVAVSTAHADVAVRFFDGTGNVLTECSGAVYTTDGVLIQKIAPEATGIYLLDIEPGQKLLFDVGDPAVGYTRFEDVAPVFGSLNVTLLGGPANDDCINAEALTLPADVSGSTVGAGTDPGAIAVGFCGTSVSDPSAGVWYTVEGTGTQLTASLSNPGTDYDTKLTVYCSDCDSLECVDGDDDGGDGLTSELTFCTQLGATYRIFVHGFSSNTGNYQLTVNDTGSPCSAEVDCLPPEPMGACCSCLVPPFNCSITTEGDCAAIGGEFQGDGTECNEPGDPIGAFGSSPNAAIPDSNPAGINDVISVDDLSVAGDVDVALVIEHTFLGDLIVTLTHPSGAPTVTLWNRVCGGNNDMDVLFDDGAPDVACNTPTVGSLNPLSADGGALEAFNGLSVQGDWTLNVSDNAGADVGTLVQWSLNFTGQGDAICPDTSGGDGGDCPGDDEDEDVDEEPDGPDQHDPIDSGSSDSGTTEMGEGQVGMSGAPIQTTDEKAEAESKTSRKPRKRGRIQ